MKTLLIAASLFVIAALSANSAPTPPGVETVRFKVFGICDDCELRIRSAIMGRGVKSVSWNPETQIATVSFVPEQVTLQQIKQRAVAAGHDVEGLRASDAAYNRLPRCCQYPRATATQQQGSCPQGQNGQRPACCSGH